MSSKILLDEQAVKEKEIIPVEQDEGSPNRQHVGSAQNGERLFEGHENLYQS